MTEPRIEINGMQLREGQALAVRVAITQAEAYFDDDANISKDRLSAMYRDRLREVLFMLGVPFE